MAGGYGPPGGGGYGPPGGGYGAPPGYSVPPQQPGYGQPPNPYGGAPPPMMQGQMPGMNMGMGYGQYEFNEMENQIIDKAAGRAKMWGWIACVLGGLQFLGYSCSGFASPVLWMNVPMAVVLLVVGIVFIGVGNSLKAVVTTQGNDLMHMMQAIQKMGSAFLIQSISWMIMAGITLVIILLMFFVFAVLVAASS